MQNGQSFMFTDTGEIMYNDLCLEANTVNDVVHFTWCYRTRIYQRFTYDKHVSESTII